jgi:TRAP-type C4-dicarboxylate transport system substrate-binding protein
LLLTALALPAGMAQAQDVQSRTIKLAFLPTSDHPIGLGAKRLAELVAEKSGGKMKVRPFPGGTLGGDLQVVSALQGGTVEMTILVTSLLAGNVKDFTLLDAPFLFENEKEADAILDGPVGQKLLEELPGRGLVGLGYFE